MRLFLDCSNTLVFGLFSLNPQPNQPVVDAVKRFVVDYPECKVVLWSAGSESDAAKTGRLCFPDMKWDVERKDYMTPQDGDFVVDDQPEYWDDRVTYEFLNDYKFFLPSEFARYGL